MLLKENKEQATKIVEAAHNEGLDLQATRQRLNDAGFRKPNGDLLSMPDVSKFCISVGFRRYEPRLRKNTKKDKRIKLRLMAFAMKKASQTMSHSEVADLFNSLGHLSARNKLFTNKIVHNMIRDYAKGKEPNQAAISAILKQQTFQTQKISVKTTETKTETPTADSVTKDIVSLLLIQQNPDLIEDLTKEQQKKLLSITLS